MERKKMYPPVVKEWGNPSVFNFEIVFRSRYKWYQLRKAVVVNASTREELASRLKEWRRALNWVRHLRNDYFADKSKLFALVEGLVPTYSLRYLAAQEQLTITVNAGSKPKPRYFIVPNKGNISDYYESRKK